MSPCLSDRALMRVVAELGEPAERAHLATCTDCAARHRRLTGEMDMIRHVLVTTVEPSLPARQAPRRWVPALATLSAVVMVGALLWIEVAVWKAIRSQSDAEPAPQVADILADVSYALFSVDGEPTSVRAQSPLVALDHASEVDGVCDGFPWPDEQAGCESAPSGLEEADEPIEVAAVEDNVFERENSDQGGEP